MSNQLYRPAYATRLGNLTAKSVLVLLCDQANDDGLGWPSVASIVKGTEILRRTVLRILEVFATMELIELKEVEVNDRFGRRTVQAIQIDLVKLGGDLTEQFAKAYAAAQGKVAVPGKAGRWRLRDAEYVSETQDESVSETQDVSLRPEACLRDAERVSETYPPDPLLGRPLIDPVPDPSLTLGAREADPFSAGQREHIDDLRSKGRNADAAMWEGYYTAQNDEEAAAARAVAEAEAQKDAVLRAEFPDLEAALTRLRRRCGFAWSEGDELGPVLRQVFADQAEMGKPFWKTAGQMASAWELQRSQGIRLRARYGPLKFFRDGHWLDSAGWHWDIELLKRDGGVRVGMQ